MMKLKKEIFLIIGISVFIIILEIVTNIITEKSVIKIEEMINKINFELKQLSNEIERGVENETYKKAMEKKIVELKKEWFKEQNKLSFFSEHDELEKVSRCLITLEENMKNEEYRIALEDGSEFLYWLNHIKEKDKLEYFCEEIILIKKATCIYYIIRLLVGREID